jgi:hypothetical protein
MSGSYQVDLANAVHLSPPPRHTTSPHRRGPVLGWTECTGQATRDTRSKREARKRSTGLRCGETVVAVSAVSVGEQGRGAGWMGRQVPRQYQAKYNAFQNAFQQQRVPSVANQVHAPKVVMYIRRWVS